MRKKGAPRRKWDLISNPVQVAMENSAITSPKRNSEHAAIEVRSIEAFARGEGSIQAWVDIVHMANVAEIMAKNGIGIEVIPLVADAQVQLCDAYVRRKETNVWNMSPTQIYLLRELREYHELQRLSVTYGQYREFMRKSDNVSKTGGQARFPAQILENAREHNAV